MLHGSSDRPGTFLGELASSNLSCAAVNYQGSQPAQWHWERGVKAGCLPWAWGQAHQIFPLKGSWLESQNTQVCVENSVHQIPLSEKELWSVFSLSLLPLILLGLCRGVEYYVNGKYTTWLANMMLFFCHWTGRNMMDELSAQCSLEGRLHVLGACGFVLCKVTSHTYGAAINFFLQNSGFLDVFFFYLISCIKHFWMPSLITC